jgi:hypothetical protein
MRMLLLTIQNRRTSAQRINILIKFRRKNMFKPRGFALICASTLTLALSSLAQAVTCAPVWTAPTDAAHPKTVSSTITLAFTANCSGGSFGFAVLYVGCADSPIAGINCPAGAPFQQFNEGGSSSFGFNTAQVANGPHDFGLGLFASNGTSLGGVGKAAPPGTDGDEVLIVSNGGAQPIATPPPAQAPSAAPPPSTPTPAPSVALPPPPSMSGNFDAGTYIIGSGGVIDGGFYQAFWGYPAAAEAFPRNGLNGSPAGTNPWQWYDFASAGDGFTICNHENGACLSDGGATVDQGKTADVWEVVPFDSGYSLQDTRTGNYMGAVPDASRAAIPMSSAVVMESLTPAG